MGIVEKEDTDNKDSAEVATAYDTQEVADLFSWLPLSIRNINTPMSFGPNTFIHFPHHSTHHLLPHQY